MNPLISVIVPSYNSEEYISETLLSVKHQSYLDWECLIIDDGSTDTTKIIVDKIIQQDKRFKYFYKENTGLSDSRNYGISLARGEFVQFLDSDDILFPDKLSISIKQYYSKNSNNTIYFSDFQFTKYNNPYETDNSIKKLYKDISKIGPIDFKKLYNEWDVDFVIPTHAFIFPIAIFENKKYDQSLKSKEDWDFYLSILSDGNTTFEPIDYIGCGYRVRSNSMSQDLSKMMFYSLVVLHKWKSTYLGYVAKTALYLIQFYLKKMKGFKLSIKTVFHQFKLYNTNAYRDLFWAHFLLPFALSCKIMKRFDK